MRQLLILLPLLLGPAAPALASDCAESAPPHELWVSIASPTAGAELRAFEPECPDALLEGTVSALGPDPLFDFYLVIDRSGSTALWSGGDVNGDGISDPLAPAGDSVLDAELAAARALLGALDLARSRVAVVRFGPTSAGATVLEQELTDDASLLQAAIDRVELAGAAGPTDLGLALRLAVDEHERGGEAGRQQVILLLSDGRPTAPTPPTDRTDGDEDCNGGRDVCSPLEQADRAVAGGLAIHAFALGNSSDSDLLEELAARTGGRVTVLDRPADLPELLPGYSTSGVDRARVENLATGESRLVAPAPDGTVREPLELLDGANELRLTAVVDGPPAAELGCSTEVSRSCLAWACPEDLLLECDGGLAAFAALRAEPPDDRVSVTNDSPFDDTVPAGDEDAAGRYPLGPTAVGFTFEDAIAGTRSCTSRVEVEDTQPPRLEDLAPELVVECPGAAPPSAARAVDDCDPAPRLEIVERRVEGPCPGTFELHRELLGVDAAGLTAAGTELVRVVDTQPPVVEGSDAELACLWPPRHDFVRLDASSFSPVVRDACGGPVSWRLAGCLSDEPEDGLGDGRFEPDCLVVEDGAALLVRSERQGTGDGRRYRVSVTAVDACGNESAPASIGFVHVPHDRRDRTAACLR